MESVSSRMPANGVFSSWLASETNKTGEKLDKDRFRRDLGDLVGAAGVSPVAVRALTHLADGLQKPADLPGQHLAEHDAQPRHQQGDQQRDNEQVVPERLQQLRLLRVVVIGVHRAHDLVVIHHRRGHAAEERGGVIVAVESIVALQRLHDLGVKGVQPHRAVLLAGVVQDAARRVRHQNAGHTRLPHGGQRLGHVFLVQLLQTAQRCLDQLHGAFHGCLLGLEHHGLGLQQRIGVQQHQHRSDHQNIADAKLKL